jgi:hypothetical protein
MTKTEIKVICLQVAGTTILPTEAVTDKAQKYFDWITEGIEFCPHCGEDGICNDEYGNDDHLRN